MASMHVVGLGLTFPAHVTQEARSAIREADRVFYVLADPFTVSWIREKNPSAEPLSFCPDPAGAGSGAWLESVAAAVDGGASVCLVLYGHPAVCVPPVQHLIRRMRVAGTDVRVLPGVSALDGLFAALGADPAQEGCRCFEATDFLIRRRTVDPTCGLVLWQVGIIGAAGYRRNDLNRDGFRVLVEELARGYGADHEVVLYEAPAVPFQATTLHSVRLGEAAEAPVTAHTTLYVPPQQPGPVDPAMLRRLGLSPERASLYPA